MTKKQVSQERKARVAQMQKQEKARERRTRLQIIAGCVVLLLVLAAVVTYAAFDARKKQPDVAISTFGVTAAAAACSPVTTDPAKGNGVHVGPGTDSPTTTKVKYATVPPSFGPHFAQPVVADRKLYTAADKPRDREPRAQPRARLHRALVRPGGRRGEDGRAAQDQPTPPTSWTPSKDKFIVSPWDPAYGALPAGKKFALSHWSATLSSDQTAVASQAGHRQLCGDISGAVVKSSSRATRGPPPRAVRRLTPAAAAPRS